MNVLKRITTFLLVPVICAVNILTCYSPVYAGSFYDGYRIGKDFVDSLVGGFTKGFTIGMNVADYITEIFDAMKSDYSDYYDPETDSFDTQSPDAPITYNSTTQEFNISQNFYNYVVNKTEKNVATLDGYYLVQNSGYSADLKDFILRRGLPNWAPYAFDSQREQFTKSLLTKVSNITNNCTNFFDLNYTNDYVNLRYHSLAVMDSDIYYLNTQGYVVNIDGSFPKRMDIGYISKDNMSAKINGALEFKSDKFYLYFGNPIMVFYNKTTYDRFVNEGRHYVPQVTLPEDGLNIPLDTVNDNTLSDLFGDLNINIGDNMTDAEIQASFDRAYQLIIDSISEGVIPTPEPTPDPIDPSPGTDLTGVNNRLDIIINYFKDNNGKLDELITALDKILKGETTGTSNGCKYDYTVLSEFLTTLWNDSDKKFDTMIELLTTNNIYQQKLVDSLNEIKALLIVDTVLDFFKNRSNETANKAKEKFPTSLPWDVALVVNTMCAEPETPIIRCPINIPAVGIQEEIVIDLSGDEWSKLAKTCRSLLSIMFVLFLVHLTREMFFKGGDS